eukprot:maker-scaffold_2-snap-gene-25.66-mRNA-1 protein AED:0.00 eAED:0.00 QI:267/1/1/1/1/1/2/856/476
MSEEGSSGPAVDLVAIELDMDIGTIGQGLFPFEGEREDMLHFEEAQIITVTNQDPSGWWTGFTLVKSLSGIYDVRRGIFPYSYVELDPGTNVTDLFPTATVLYDLDPQSIQSEETTVLQLVTGETVTILRYVNDDWVFAQTLDGRQGECPVKYLQRTGEFDENMLAREKERWVRLTNTRNLMFQKLKEQIENVEVSKSKQEHKELTDTIQSLKEQNEKQRQDLNEARRLLALARSEIKQLKEAKKSRRTANHVSVRFNAPPGPPPTIKQFESDPFEGMKTVRRKHKPLFKATYELEEEEEPDSPQSVKQDVNQSKIVRAGTLRPVKLGAASSSTSVVISGAQKLDSPNEVKAVQEEPAVKVPASPQPAVEPKKFQVASKFRGLGKGPKCKVCAKSVGIAGQVKACGGIYHDYCFRCSTCNKVIRNGEYVDNNNVPYCNKCHKRGFGPKGVGNGLSEVPTKAKAAPAKGVVSTQSWV